MTGLAIGQTCSVQGDAEVCPGEMVTYTIDLNGCQGSPTGYLWNVSGDGTISGSNIGAAVTVLWSATGGGVVSVNVTGITGIVTPLNVVIYPVPNPVITTDVDLACTGHGDPTQEPCFMVCENSSSTFTVANNSGSQYIWTVSGGSGTSTTNEMTVNWGTHGTGSVQVTEINAAGCSHTVTHCVIKIRKPGALFSTVPYSNILSGQDLVICLGQPIWFTNESFAPATGPTITGVIWDFGDGTILQTGLVDNPSHTYANHGNYTVTLTVTNQCNCSSVLSLNVVVLPDLWVDILCATPVCANSLATYTTNAVCSTYVWSVTNGNIITTPNNNASTIQVQWGNGQNGPGTISLQGINCNVPCNNVSSIVIPIYANPATVAGPNPACSNAITTYSVPLVPGTGYLWMVSPAPPSNIISGQNSNQITIDWNGYIGPATISCQYENTFLGCPPANSGLTVDVRESFTVTGPPEICENMTTAAVYAALFTYAGTTNFRFRLKNAAGAYLYTWNNVTSAITIGSWSYGSGLFTLEVIDLLNLFCSSPVTIQIEVHPSPPAPVSITGDAEVCGGGNYSYLASPLPSIQFSYQWNITGGVPATATGNPLAVTWADPLPQGSQIALSVTDITTGCQSVPFVLPVNPIPVVAPLVEGPRMVCLNTISTYQIGNWASMNCNKVEWSISPPSAGSIISGFMDPVMSIQWNNMPNSGVVLWLTTYTCGLQDNYPIYINLNENTLPVTVTPNPVCEGVPATIDIATASSHAPLPLPDYQWSIESGTGYTNFTSTSVPIQHTFSLYQHPNPVFNGSVIAHYNDVNDLLSVNNCETGTFNVTVLPKPSVNINASSIYVCPGPIILDAPAGFISYQWSNGANSAQTTVTQTGMYTVTVTDIYGCTGTGFIELYDCPCVNDPTIPVNQFTHTIANCITKTVEFSVSGNYNPAYVYDFSYGDGAHQIITAFSPFPTAVHSYSMPGTYTVCLKVIDPLPDPDHCYEWCTQVVIPLSAAFTMDIDCPSPDPSMYSVTFVNLSYSVNPATYSWKVGGVPFSTATDPVVQWPAGTYVVELTATSGNDQCTISGTVDIPAVPAPPLFTITGDPFCEKQTPVNFDYSGGPAAQIASALWQFGDQTESRLFPHTERVFNSANSPLPYTATLDITDIYGCPFNHSENIFVNPNGLTGQLIVTPDPFCAGSAAAANYNQMGSLITPTHYLWSDGQTTNPAIAFEAGNWMVTVSDLGPGHSGCTEVFGPLNIGMFNIPVPYFTGEGNLCSGELLFLEGYYGASYNYTWTVDPPFLGLPSTTPPWQYELNTINENPGTYLVTLTLEDPVNACVRTYTGQITIGDIPPQPVISANPPILCAGTPTVLDITNNPAPPNQYNVNWSTGASSNSITVTGANIYMATFTNQAGCTQSSSVTMNDVPNLDWVVMGCYDYCANEMVVIPGNPNIIYQNWEWLVNGIIVDSDNNTAVNDLDLNQFFGSPLQVGIYTVQLVVTDVNNCTTWSEPITITIRQCPCNIERVISQLRCIGVDANNIAHYFFDFSVQYNFPPATNNIQLVSTNPCFGVALNPVTNPFQLTGILSVNLSCGTDPKVICLRLLYNDPPHNSCVFDFCVPLPVCQNPVLCGVEFNPFEVLCNGTDFAGNPVYSFNFNLNPVAGNFNVFFSSPHGQVTGFPASIGPGAGPYSGTITDTPPLTVPGGLFCIQMNVWSDNPVDAVCHERFCFSLPVCGSGDPDRGTPVQGNNHLLQTQAEGAGVRLSPNPVHDRLDILCALPDRETGWLTIEDMRGNTHWMMEVTGSAYPITVEVNSFPSGIYVVSLRGKSFPKVIKKLVILK